MFTKSDRYILKLFVGLFAQALLIFVVILMTVYTPFHYSNTGVFSSAFKLAIQSTIFTMSYMYPVCCMLASVFCGIKLVASKNIIILQSLSRTNLRIFRPVLFFLLAFFLFIVLVHEGVIKKHAYHLTRNKETISNFALDRLTFTIKGEKKEDFSLVYLRGVSINAKENMYEIDKIKIMNYINNEPDSYTSLENAIAHSSIVKTNAKGSSKDSPKDQPDTTILSTKKPFLTHKKTLSTEFELNLKFSNLKKILQLEYMSDQVYSPIEAVSVINIMKQNGKNPKIIILRLFFALSHALLIFPVSIFSFGVCVRTYSRVERSINLIIQALVFTIMSILISDMFVLYSTSVLSSVVMPITFVVILALLLSGLVR